MKVAIFSPYATVAPHFETELEIAQLHADAGDDVEIVACTGGLANCDFNPQREESRCRECRLRRLNGLDQIAPRPNLIPLEADVEPVELDIEDLDVETLKSFRIDGFDIGYAALSSLVSLTREPVPDFGEQGALLGKLLVSALQTYRFTLQYIERNSPDRIYVFNGRFAAMRAVLRACEERGVDCQIHERGCDKDHFELSDNHLPHDIDAVCAKIRRLWEAAGNREDRQQVASQWFHDRVDRVESNWVSFVKDQQRGSMPENWSNERKNIGIFNSSDDEFVAIGDQWKQVLYPSQVEAIRTIAADLLVKSPEIHLYLRVHPNLRGASLQQRQALMDLASPNLTVIPADDVLDSYSLMRNVDQVVSFGSSVGIEAVFWKRPSVLLGPCFYRSLGGTWQPETHAQTIEMLTSDLTPLTAEGALMYGFWLQTRGQKYKYFSAEDLFSGKFKGEPIWAQLPKIKRSVGFRLKRETRRLFNKIVGAE